ncbi:MAG: SLBB domain-containing protein [Fimbriimonadia bacterium]
MKSVMLSLSKHDAGQHRPTAREAVGHNRGMKHVCALATLLCLACSLGWADGDAYRLRIGDSLTVRYLFCPEGQEQKDPPEMHLTVPPGGVLTLPHVGQVQAEGRPVLEVQNDVVERLRRHFPLAQCTILLTGIRPSYYSIIGEVKQGGQFELPPGLTLREAVARAGGTLRRPELLLASVYRDGKLYKEFDLFSIGTGDDAVAREVLQPGDVVSIQTRRQMRVWLAGQFQQPGERAVEQGTTLRQALADMVPAKADRAERLIVTVTRQGAEALRTTLYDVQTGRASEFPMQDGDFVAMAPEETNRVWVFGVVEQPGQYDLPVGSTLVQALSMAGGAKPEASLRDVQVLRGKETLRVDLRDPKQMEQTPLTIAEGDIVLVRENARRVAVVGEVRQPGLFVMRDDVETRLSDALALAGGLTKRGPAARITLIRVSSDGTVSRIPVDFSKYLKSADASGNPLIVSGDVVVAGETPRIELGDVASVLLGAVGLWGLIRQ